jgi:hypothetical protein
MKSPGPTGTGRFCLPAASFDQTRTALNSVPEIAIAATAERKAFAKLRIVFPLSGMRGASCEGANGAMHKITQLRNL